MTNENMANLVYEAAVVKRLKRTGWQIMGDDNEEGVGEHIFMTCVIAYLLTKQINGNPESQEKANMETVMLMSVFHDFHEARTGELDKIAKLYTQRDEGKANTHIFQGVDDELLSILETYEEKQTPEARIVYEANVIAFSVEVKLLLEKGNTHAAEWLASNDSRLRLPEAVALAAQLAKTDSHVWWKDLREVIREEFTR